MVYGTYDTPWSMGSKSKVDCGYTTVVLIVWLYMDREAGSVGFLTATSSMTLAAVYGMCLEVVSVSRICYLLVHDSCCEHDRRGESGVQEMPIGGHRRD